MTYIALFNSMQTRLAGSQGVLGEEQQKIVEVTRPDVIDLGLEWGVKMESNGCVSEVVKR